MTMPLPESRKSILGLIDENENLSRLVAAHKVERDRMRSTLISLRDWDMLSLKWDGHAAVWAAADAPWARKLIADALGEEVELPPAPSITSHAPNPGPTIMGGTLALCRDCTEKVRRNAAGEWEHFDVGRPYEPMEIK